MPRAAELFSEESDAIFRLNSGFGWDELLSRLQEAVKEADSAAEVRRGLDRLCEGGSVGARLLRHVLFAQPAPLADEIAAYLRLSKTQLLESLLEKPNNAYDDREFVGPDNLLERIRFHTHPALRPGYVRALEQLAADESVEPRYRSLAADTAARARSL